MASTSRRPVRQLAALVLVTVALAARPQPPATAASAPPPARAAFGALAPAFVENAGEAAAARFVSVGGGHPIFLTDRDVRLVDPGRRRSLWLSFVGGAAARVEGDSPTGGGVAHLTGVTAARQRPAYRDVVYRRIWPGIDARVTGVTGGIEYSFELAPGADPAAIRLRYLGVDGTTLNANGELVLDAGGQTIVDRAPIAYQRIDGRSRPVEVRFVQRDDDVTFALGAYDRTQPLVIDPTLVYSTYLGGSGADVGHAIAVDSAGAAYVAGGTRSSDFPTTPGAFQTTMPSQLAAFVAKINPAGTHFDYVTYLGGSTGAEAFGIAVDAGGNAYVAGHAGNDFPTTSGAYRNTPNGGSGVFVAKLNPAGSDLIYSALVGDTNPEVAALAIDSVGNAYVTGTTIFAGLPITSGAVGGPQTYPPLVEQAYLLKFDSTGSTLAYATYIGGSGNDQGTGVTVDAGGRAVVVGTTTSSDLKTTAASVQPNPNSAAFKSSDAAQTFAAVNGSPHSRDVRDIAIDPQQPANVYEATFDQGVLKSTDGGTTWSRRLGKFGVSVAINPITPTTVFAVVGSGGSDDPGTPLLNRSTDGGANWTVVLWQVGAFAIAPSNPSTLYAASGANIVKSTDNGNTWSDALVSTTPSAIAIDPANPSVAYVGNQYGQVVKTSNGGASWTIATLGSAPVTVNAIAVDPTSTSVIWAATSGGLFESTDGGVTWSQKFIGVSAPSRVVFDGGTLYVADGGYGTSLVKTSDRGAHWSSETIRGNSVAIRALAAAGGNVWVGITAHQDAFAYKIDTNATTPEAALIYGTYVGGSLDDAAVGVALDPSGNAVVGLQTASKDLPITMTTSVNPRQMAVARLTPDGTAYAALTYTVGGSFYTFLSAIAVDRNGYAYTAGIDQDGYYLWIEQVDGAGASIVEFAQFNEALNTVNGIAADSSGGLYVTGAANAFNLRATPNAPQPSYGGGATDAYVEKISFGDSVVDLAQGQTAVASSTQAPQYAASNAVDGDPTTRWSSQFSDPQWIYVDLGRETQIDHVVLRWETAYGR